MSKHKGKDLTIRSPNLLRPLLALMSAALTVLAFPKASVPWLGFICLVPLLLAVRGVSGKKAFYLGWLMGAATNAGGFYWISHTLTEFAGLPWPVAWLGVVLNSAYSGLLFGLWALGTRKIQDAIELPVCAYGPALFAGLEWFFPLLFPWYLGDSQYNFLPLAQSAEAGGIILVSFVLVLVSTSLYDTIDFYWRKKRFYFVPAAATALFVSILCLVGWLRAKDIEDISRNAPKMKIGIVQVNVSHWDKMDPSKYWNILDKFSALTRTLTRDVGVDLVLWPETAVTFQVDLDDMKAPAWARQFDKPLITGGLSCKGISCMKLASPYYNSAFLFEPGQDKVVDVYHKMHPMLFSEYIPFGEHLPFIYEWFPYAGRFTKGPSTKVFDLNGWHLGMMICYEDIIPRFGLDLVNRSPNVFINLTNDSWFGDTAEPYQHMALAVFRSIEHRKALVRSTNTGISCFVDPAGRIRKTSGLFKTQLLVDEVPKMEIVTLYAKYGDWFPLSCTMWILVLVLFAGFKARRHKALHGGIA